MPRNDAVQTPGAVENPLRAVQESKQTRGSGTEGRNRGVTKLTLVGEGKGGNVKTGNDGEKKKARHLVQDHYHPSQRTSIWKKKE